MQEGILFLIQQSGMLMQMPRSHSAYLGTTFDTVASHSFHVGIIAYCLARMEKLSHEEGMKAMMMGILHDLVEARTGDLNFVTKNYAKVDEPKAVKDQFANIDFGPDLEKLIEEYEQRETMVAKCAKDADALEQLYLEWVMMWQGNKLAEKWFEGALERRLPHYRTESAKKLALAMKDSNPQQWWWGEFVEKNFNSENLNGKK